MGCMANASNQYRFTHYTRLRDVFQPECPTAVSFHDFRNSPHLPLRGRFTRWYSTPHPIYAAAGLESGAVC
ncbi:hypothetical protein NE612_07045 [Oscillibacter valericigenes]|nr:hypothetical protein [Oscillibacter valericigenes]